ncbi:hypothetical protein VTO42DRAFT_5111 [Malbranchea cinnamomea]
MGLGSWFSITCLAWTFLCGQLLAADILKNNGFTTCLDNGDIRVEKLNLLFDRSTGTVRFDAAGTSYKTQPVTASLVVTAYGQEFTQDFDPCDEATYVEMLCPVPAGHFAAQGEQKLEPGLIDKIPSIAFAIPDLEAFATLQLYSKDGNEELACIQSTVCNGKTIHTPAVSYAAAGIAGAALVMGGVSALGSAGTAGAATTSPSFGEVFGWFQSMALNGMLSVNYPPIYRNFAKNFAFSTGLFPWDQLQTSIDNFRNMTGGNLTESSLAVLRNTTLIHSRENSNPGSLAKRAIDTVLSHVMLAPREISTSVNETASEGGDDELFGQSKFVEGVQAFVEELSIPEANTFMTVLLIFAIVVAAIAVGILLCKVILELWALRGSFPAKLTNFRKHYWWYLGRTITNLILILYGIWTLYCVFQFTRGDSWAAKLLAGVTLAIFTAVLGYFTIKIWLIAHRAKKTEGDASVLFDDKETWRKYSLFYDHYKRGYWWIFVPLIVYMFARGCIIAAGDGHGLVQSGGQLIVEGTLLILLLWTRPFETKASQWINIAIQVVRVLSVCCILVFVHEFGISQTTQTVTGLALIIVQSTLTGLLAILMAVNAIILCFGKNPHEERHKLAEKSNCDLDNLTPLDARNSLLLDPKPKRRESSLEVGKFNYLSRYEPYRDVPLPKSRHVYSESTDQLVSNGENIPHGRSRSRESESRSISPERDPMLPGRAF